MAAADEVYLTISDVAHVYEMAHQGRVKTFFHNSQKLKWRIYLRCMMGEYCYQIIKIQHPQELLLEQRAATLEADNLSLRQRLRQMKNKFYWRGRGRGERAGQPKKRGKYCKLYGIN